jgi:ABC-type uncharacterized transport system ATPase subunit
MTQAVDRVTPQAVECTDLSYQFATHLAVDQVNLSIEPGEMYGLLAWTVAAIVAASLLLNRLANR